MPDNAQKTVNEGGNYDPTANVIALVEASIKRLDDIHVLETKRLDENINYLDDKYQMQFNAQEKAVAAALEGTKEAINKADINTDKRFSLLSEKIDGITSTISKSSGERGIYVTHTDLNIAIDKLQASIEATLRPVVTFMNAQKGQQKGAGTSWQTMVTIISAAGTLIAIFFALNK
jgi:hypothetical protein